MSAFSFCPFAPAVPRGRRRLARAVGAGALLTLASIRGLAVILVALGLIGTGAADASAEPLTLELQVSGLGDRDITVTQDSKRSVGAVLRETETFVVRASASDPTRTHSIFLGAVQYTMCRARGTNLIKVTPYIKIGPSSSQFATPGNAAVQQISVSPQTANLCGDWFTIRRVTALRATAENGVKELGSPSVSLGSMHWTQVGHANDVVAMATAGTPTMLYAATSDRTIWIRDPVEIDVSWQPFAPPAPAPVRGLAVVPSQNAPPFFSTSLIVATSTNRLFAYNPSFPLWHDIGHANNITGMTVYSGKLYATTSDNRLWRRELVFSEVDWEPITSPELADVHTLTSGPYGLLAVTDSGRFWALDPASPTDGWMHIGYADGVRAIAGINGTSPGLNGKVFGATTSNQLLISPPGI